MSLEQKAHDIGIAFATVKMQARISSLNGEDREISEIQYLNFITDYVFASSNVITSNELLDVE